MKLKDSKSSRSKEDNNSHMVIIAGFFLLVIIMLALADLARINAEGKDAEKKRGDILQQSLDTLRARSNEDRDFFDIVRQLITTQDAQDRQALIDQLKNFKFASGGTSFTPVPTGTTTTVPAKKTSTSTGALKPETTTTSARASPTTTATTTTTRPPSTSTTTTTFCLNVSVVNTCK